MDEIFKNEETNKTKKYFRTFGMVVIVLSLFVLFWVFILRPPKMEEPVLIHISKGDSVEFIANQLEDKNVVGSSKFLQSFIAFLGGDQKIKLGDYYFDEPLWLPNVAYRIVSGVHNIDPIKVTIPEGSNNSEILLILERKLPEFDGDKFLKETQNLQGYLFPDTYFIYPLTTVSEVVSILKDTFKQKTKKVLAQGYKNYSQDEILVMASIIEEEASGDKDRDIIAGILWSRLEKGMLLQVDAEPSTYKIQGLPQKPITNSGLASLEATVNPKESSYLFYLHDKSGMIHLAKTYTEHKNNIKKYLK